MKYIYNKLPIITIFILLFISCNKEVDIISSFEFSIEESHEELSVINYPQKTIFKIVPEKEVTSVQYSFKYEVLNGSGSYLNSNEEVLDEDVFYPLESLSINLFYKGTSISDDKVKITIKDSEGREVQEELLYKVKHNEYALEASTPVQDVNINVLKSFSISLFNIDKDKSLTYERAFYIIQGTGEIFNSENEEKEIELEKFESIQSGTSTNYIKFLESGESKLVVSTRDSNGQIKNDTIIFNVRNIDFSFSAAADVTTTFINEEFNYNFTLTEDNGNGGEYKIRYEIEEGNINISNGSNNLSAGTLYNAPIGNFTWKARASSEQTSKVKFYLRNQNGEELEKVVTVIVTGGSSSFDAIPTKLEAEVDEVVTFNSIITANGPVSSPYSLIYSSTGSSTLNYKGTVYTPGQVISNITDFTFALDYKGLSEGEHTIQFILSDKDDNPFQIEKKINFINTDFTFVSEETSKTAFVNDCTNINFNLAGLNTLTYTMIWRADVSGSFVYNGTSYSTNTPIVIEPGSFTGCFKGTSGGLSNLTFEVTASNNKKEISDVDLTINAFSHNLNIPETIDVVAGDRANFNINYSASNYNVDAKLFYTISDSDAKLKFLDSNILSSPHSLVAGDLNLFLDYEEAKNYTITWTYINNLGYDETYNTELNVSNLPYSLSLVSNKEEAYNDDIIEFTLGINTSNQTQKYKLVGYTLNSGSGVLEYDSNTIPSNFILPTESTIFTFIPNRSDDEDLDITFIVEDEFGQRKEISKQIIIKDYLGDWNVTGGTFSYFSQDPRTGRKTYYYHYEILSTELDPGSGSEEPNGGFSKLLVSDENDNFLFEVNFGETTGRNLPRICSNTTGVSCADDSNSPPITYIVRAVNKGITTNPKTITVNP